MRSGFACALIVAALVTVSCGSVVDPSQNVTQTFSGTVTNGGSPQIFEFSTSKSGEYSIKITALAPNANVYLLTLYGQSLGPGSCSPLQENQFSTLNQTSLGGAITPGTWCVGIQDSLGVLTAPETFTLSVAHP
jgi:hypothetical protein